MHSQVRTALHRDAAEPSMKTHWLSTAYIGNFAHFHGTLHAVSCGIVGAALGIKLLDSTELVVKAPEGEVVAPGDLWVVPGKGLPRAPSWYGVSNLFLTLPCYICSVYAAAATIAFCGLMANKF